MGTSASGKLLRDRMENDFAYHAPDAEKARKHEGVRAAARAFARFVADACPEGREQSLAITKIEEAMMWANAALARNN